MGLPAREDKLLQAAVARILNALYAQEVLPCRYGDRQGRGALQAVKELSFQLQYKPYHYLVEADIEGFFDPSDPGPLLAWLAERIDDRPFLRLVEKWLKAGIWESAAAVVHPVRGTPQGGNGVTRAR